MTNEQQKAKELAELLNAFAEGKQLQYQSEQFGWCGASSLAYIADSVINGKRPIRIKPETKQVALTRRDLVDRELKKDTMRVVNNNLSTHISYLIDEIYPYKIKLSDGTYMDYECLAENYTFLDGTPCYKEVEDVA